MKITAPIQTTTWLFVCLLFAARQQLPPPDIYAGSIVRPLPKCLSSWPSKPDKYAWTDKAMQPQIDIFLSSLSPATQIPLKWHNEALAPITWPHSPTRHLFMYPKKPKIPINSY